MDKDTFRNHQPVSNLNIVSKVSEKAVASQIKLIHSRLTAITSWHTRTIIPWKPLFSLSRNKFLLLWKGKIVQLLNMLLDLLVPFDTIDLDLNIQLE